jgi:drug/metabolite transporter (DMT)-like permease
MLLGIAAKILSTLLFAGMQALVKYYSAYPIAELVFFRSAFALVVLVIWLLMRGDFPRALYTTWFSGHLVRSIAGVGSMFLLFAAYGLLPLADVAAISYAGPLIIVVLAAVLLHEKVNAGRWAAVCIGFAGVIVMLWEHLGAGLRSANAIGALCAFSGASLVALAMIQTRRLTRTEDTGAIVFYFQGTTTLVSLLIILLGDVWPVDWWLGPVISAQAWVWPEASHWWPLICTGLLGGAAQIFMTQSYRLTDASIIACFDYTSMIWALAIGFVIFGELPTPLAFVGAGIIVGGGLLAIFSERAARKA